MRKGETDAAPPVPAAPPEPLRERRRRELRQQLSDMATAMFLERGFDAVRVADVARACGVTEKTVFNHFRSKESLLADRWDTQVEALSDRLGDARTTPVDAALAVLGEELDVLTGGAGREQEVGLAVLRRFSDLVRTTPSLVAHDREALDRLRDAAAEVLARRAGVDVGEPEASITAAALAGLWHVYGRSLHRHLATARTTADLAQGVRRDLAVAARTLHEGI